MYDHANVSVIVGAQWGDEGKGKWIDVLAKSADFVVRYQGGNNAGHTLWIDGRKFVLHQIPSGLFHKGAVSAMAAGVVVFPQGLVEELEKLKEVASISPENFWISARAHVITPWTIYLDQEKESKAESAIGTTKRGIGPTYSLKADRIGIRMGEFINKDQRTNWFLKMESLSSNFKKHRQENAEVWEKFERAAIELAPFVRDVETCLRQKIIEGKAVLLEGAQGTLLDIDHGTFPFVTSSSTIASGACTSIGLSPKALKTIIGVCKAYVTRVGAGPMPSELFDVVGSEIARKGHEFGATTGRPRRCGWFDAVAMRYSSAINGFDQLIVNKIDILTGLEKIAICVAYEHPELGLVRDFPWDQNILKDCKPVYKEFEGWKEEPPKTGKISDLPRNAKRFIDAIEDYVGVKIAFVGTGPGRNEMLTL